ncbi:protein of unknown function DUF4371 [Trinorchestia longiramus]|nr:protein of unknown function DUF4371 [Trinorchestia longiramus]
MICCVKLSNSSLAPTKLRKHFLKLHCDGKYMNTTLAEFNVKKARFDERDTLPILGFEPIKKPILAASCEITYLIAKQGKPQSIGETLVKPAVLKMANIMLGKEAEVKLSQITPSNDTISDRIEDMSRDILAQVVADLISSPAKFSLQLDETTDVFNLSQLAVFVRYVKDNVIKEYFLFCKLLTTTTKAADVKKLMHNFFKNNSLSWDMVSAVCSDRAPVMLGRKSGFSAVVKADAPHIIVTHCILHRHALATKTLPPKLVEVLKIVVESMNYIRTSALRHRIFSKLCKEMGSEFEVLLYHSNVRWLPRGQVLNRVFANFCRITPQFAKQFPWTEADAQSFRDLKEALADCPTLSFPSPKVSDYHIVSDSASSAVGAAVYPLINCKPTLIAFFSKKLSDLQKTYATYDREWLAILSP